MSNNEESKEVFVAIGDFDKTRLRVLFPETHSFTKGDSEIEWTTSEGRYLNDAGELCELYIEFPPAFCFGINAIHPIGTSKEDKTVDAQTGLQICYPITSMKTIDKPTKEEQHTKEVLDALFNVTWEYMQTRCELDIDESGIPGPAYNSFLGAIRGGKLNPFYAVKATYTFPLTTPKGSKKKVEDRTKPARLYMKLITKGNGRKLRCITPVHGPGDQKVNASKYMDVRGHVHPVVKWDGVFWGSHGQKATHGASVRLRVCEMNYVPQSDGVPHRRMLGANSAPIVEDDGSDDDEDLKDDGKDEGFVQPGDDTSPLEGLNADEETEETEETEEIEEEPAATPPPKKTVKKVAKKTTDKSSSDVAARRKAAMIKKRKAAAKSQDDE